MCELGHATEAGPETKGGGAIDSGLAQGASRGGTREDAGSERQVSKRSRLKKKRKRAMRRDSSDSSVDGTRTS